MAATRVGNSGESTFGIEYRSYGYLQSCSVGRSPDQFREQVARNAVHRVNPERRGMYFDLGLGGPILRSLRCGHFSGDRTGPARNLYFGTHAEFQLSNVAPQRAHSKLLVSRSGIADSVRR